MWDCTTGGSHEATTIKIDNLIVIKKTDIWAKPDSYAVIASVMLYMNYILTFSNQIKRLQYNLSTYNLSGF